MNDNVVDPSENPDVVEQEGGIPDHLQSESSKAEAPFHWSEGVAGEGEVRQFA